MTATLIRLSLSLSSFLFRQRVDLLLLQLPNLLHSVSYTGGGQEKWRPHKTPPFLSLFLKEWQVLFCFSFSLSLLTLCLLVCVCVCVVDWTRKGQVTGRLFDTCHYRVFFLFHSFIDEGFKKRKIDKEEEEKNCMRDWVHELNAGHLTGWSRGHQKRYRPMAKTHVNRCRIIENKVRTSSGDLSGRPTQESDDKSNHSPECVNKIIKSKNNISEYWPWFERLSRCNRCSRRVDRRRWAGTGAICWPSVDKRSRAAGVDISVKRLLLKLRNGPASWRPMGKPVPRSSVPPSPVDGVIERRSKIIDDRQSSEEKRKYTS